MFPRRYSSKCCLCVDGFVFFVMVMCLVRYRIFSDGQPIDIADLVTVLVAYDYPMAILENDIRSKTLLMLYNNMMIDCNFTTQVHSVVI